LKVAGFSVAVSLTIDDALEAVTTSAIGCVILDHHLADADGEKLLGAEGQRPPTILMSGMGRGALARLWHQNAERLFACLPKPIPPQDLIEVVRSAVRPGTQITTSRPIRPWDVGTWVYVRDPRTDIWSGGFAVVEVLDDGYRLRRLWEGDVLDEPAPFADVRPERRTDPFRR
jgi:DNA-binding response OmpR family regulator